MFNFKNFLHMQYTIFDEYVDQNYVYRKDLVKRNTYITDDMSEHHKRILRYENMHLSSGITFTDNGIPELAPYYGELPSLNQIYPYTEKKGLIGTGQGLHMFVADYRFANPLWKRLQYKTMELSKFDLLFAPDYSVFVNPNYKQISIQGIYKSRFIAAYWQQCGFNVVPVASWGDVNSFKWCFEGLPDGGIIAVGNETVQIRDHSSVTLWQWGMRELEIQKKPSMILVYGKRIDVPELQTPIRYIDSFIKKHFRNGRHY